jgi:NitT/TauT family transport system permease protein
MPFSLALRSIPLVAITPLLLRIRFSIADLPVVKSSPILYPIFGTEQAIKMFIVCIVVFFPTLVNVYQGFKSVDTPALELMHSLNASPWFVFWNLRVPSALPLTFSALKIAASSSVGGVVIAEWLSSNKGLGYIMYAGSSSASLTTADMWVGMILSTVLAVVLFWLVSTIEKLAIPWHESVIALKEAMEGFDKEPV